MIRRRGASGGEPGKGERCESGRSVAACAVAYAHAGDVRIWPSP